MHGLFSDDRQRAAWLKLLESGPSSINYEILITQTLEQLAAHLAMHIDLDRLLSLSR
jgi:adenosylcobyric acid synthase